MLLNKIVKDAQRLAVQPLDRLSRTRFPFYNDLSKSTNAQRLAAQPLGRVRYVVTILAGILKSQSGVLSLSLGQVGCSRGLGVFRK
jgi:hypothetical protein